MAISVKRKDELLPDIILLTRTHRTLGNPTKIIPACSRVFELLYLIADVPHQRFRQIILYVVSGTW